LWADLNISKLNNLSKLELWIKKSWAMSLAVTSLLIFIAFIFLPSSNNITYGFAAYYTASHLVMEHQGGSIFYDDRAFQVKVESLTDGQASDIYWANPPTTALMFLPLASLSISTARYLWAGVSLISLFLAVTLLGSVIFKTPFQSKAFYVTTAILFLSAPLTANFRYGQAYVLLLVFYAIALFALSSGREWLAGFCLALVLALKASGLPLLVLLIIRGRWRIIAWALLVFAGLVLISIHLVGVPTWRIYLLNVIPNFLADPVIAVTAYQTVPGFIRHLFTYHDIWNPSPLTNWPTFAKLFNLFVAFILVGIAGIRSKQTTLEWTFSVGLLLSVILVPAAEQHHYILLFPAFLLAVRSPRIPRVLLYLAAALIVLPLAYTAKPLSSGWWVLMAYPRLYGALILFAILHFDQKDSEPSPPDEATNVDAFSSAQ
jgi:hypothetical protein